MGLQRICRHIGLSKDDNDNTANNNANNNNDNKDNNKDNSNDKNNDTDNDNDYNNYNSESNNHHRPHLTCLLATTPRKLQDMDLKYFRRHFKHSKVRTWNTCIFFVPFGAKCKYSFGKIA